MKPSLNFTPTALGTDTQLKHKCHTTQNTAKQLKNICHSKMLYHYVTVVITQLKENFDSVNVRSTTISQKMRNVFGVDEKWIQKEKEKTYIAKNAERKLPITLKLIGKKN